jgi:hypothetical protein
MTGHRHISRPWLATGPSRYGLGRLGRWHRRVGGRHGCVCGWHRRVGGRYGCICGWHRRVGRRYGCVGRWHWGPRRRHRGPRWWYRRLRGWRGRVCWWRGKLWHIEPLPDVDVVRPPAVRQLQGRNRRARSRGDAVQRVAGLDDIHRPRVLGRAAWHGSGPSCRCARWRRRRCGRGTRRWCLGRRRLWLEEHGRRRRRWRGCRRGGWDGSWRVCGWCVRGRRAERRRQELVLLAHEGRCDHHHQHGTYHHHSPNHQSPGGRCRVWPML